MEGPREVDFELGEDAPRNAAARAVQEAAWSGANIDARQHFSVREATQIYRPAIIDAQSDFYCVRELVRGQQQQHSKLSPLSAELLGMIVDEAMPGQGALVGALVAREHARPAALRARARQDVLAPFRVFVRVRPLLAAEEKSGEYAALDVGDRMSRALVVHDGRLARSGRRLTMTHKFYAADGVWPAHADEREIFDLAARPLLERAMAGVGDATLLLYGQTGAGKTHTLMGLLRSIAAELPACAAATRDANTDADAAGRPTGARVTFFEVSGRERAGGGAYDLLNARAPVRLCSDASGITHARGASAVQVRTGAELLGALADGLALRKTAATERNALSSRSHAVCVLELAPSGRTLRLVDLAGSERNYETRQMSAAEHRESAAINHALFSLKECFRHAAKAHALAREAGAPRALNELGAAASSARVRVPFRASALTRVLQQCFVDLAHRTAIIAAVAPGSADVLHTLNTLDYTTMMAPHLGFEDAEGRAPTPAVPASGGPTYAAGTPMPSVAFEHALAPPAFAVVLDVPMRRRHRAGDGDDEFAYERLPVHRWTAEHVRAWIANAHGGRFAQVVLPSGTDGRALLNLSARRLTEMVEEDGRVGRGGAGEADGAAAIAAGAQPGALPAPAQGEVAWYISSQARIGRALFAALRDEQRGLAFDIDEEMAALGDS